MLMVKFIFVAAILIVGFLLSFHYYSREKKFVAIIIAVGVETISIVFLFFQNMLGIIIPFVLAASYILSSYLLNVKFKKS